MRELIGRLVLCLFLGVDVALLSTAAAADPLIGKVELLKKMEPIKDGKLDSTAGSKGNAWFKVPNWSAGTWESLSSLQVFMSDERSKREETGSRTLNENRHIQIGWQKDKLGSIWQREEELRFKPSALKMQVEDKDKLGKEPKILSEIIYRKLVNEDANSITVITTTYFPKHNTAEKWVNTESKQSISTYRNIEPEIMLQECEERDFDSDGFPTKTRRFFSIFRLMKSFEPIERVGNFDVQASFRKFLSDNNNFERMSERRTGGAP